MKFEQDFSSRKSGFENRVVLLQEVLQELLGVLLSARRRSGPDPRGKRGGGGAAGRRERHLLQSATPSRTAPATPSAERRAGTGTTSASSGLVQNRDTDFERCEPFPCLVSFPLALYLLPAPDRSLRCLTTARRRRRELFKAPRP